MIYRPLLTGEITQEDDEVATFNDTPQWVKATRIGEPAPDPAYPSHRQYRRPVK